METPAGTLTPLIGMTLQQLREVAAANSLPQFAAKQMAQWLYEKRAVAIDEIPTCRSRPATA